jgi:hypothetical protein
MNGNAKPKPKANRRRSGILLGALAVLWAFELFHPLACVDGVDDPEAFAQAARAAASDMKQGDLLVVHPPWRDDAVASVNALQGVLPPGVKAELVLPKHAGKKGRVVVIEDAAWAWPKALRRLVPVVDSRKVAGLKVHVLRGPEDDAKRSRSLVDEIHRAQVVVRKADGTETKCHWDAGKNRHRCPGHFDWMYVGPHRQHSGGQAKDCLWAHPISGGSVIVTFAPQAFSGPLTFSHAVSDQAAANPKGVPVTAVIRVDGQEKNRVVRTNRAGFVEKNIEAPAGKAVTVQVEIQTVDDGSRHYCFGLEDRGGQP